MSEAKTSSYELSINLEREGYYLRALQVLDDATPHSSFRISAEVQRACLLERIGQHDESLALLNRITSFRGLTSSQRSACEHALGRIEWDRGDGKAALSHFTRAVSLAERASDLRERCWPLMSLLLATSHSPASGPSDQMLSLLRSDVLKVGDARVLAELHETLGRIEGKRGLARSAKTHFRRAAQLLETAPHIYL